MENKNQEYTIRETLVTSKIYVVRNKKIMLDRDLAELYEVETRVLNQAVSRNIERFPEEFMFQLTNDEFEILMSQIVISSWGGTRKMPFAFTEYGVAICYPVYYAAKEQAADLVGISKREFIETVGHYGVSIFGESIDDLERIING